MTHIDRFTAGLDELTRKEQASYACVLSVLNETGRFSVFEAGENPTIAGTLDRLIGEQLIEVTPDAFPWSKVKLTDAGKQILKIPE